MKFKWASLFSFPLVCVWFWDSFHIDWNFRSYLEKVNRESRKRGLRNTYGHDWPYFSDELLLGGSGREFHLNLIPQLCYQTQGLLYYYECCEWVVFYHACFFHWSSGYWKIPCLIGPSKNNPKEKYSTLKEDVPQKPLEWKCQTNLKLG